MQVIRSYDFVGRYGGEEFLVVLPACDRIHAFQSAERIRSAGAAAPISVNNLAISVTTSIGVTAVAAEVCKKQLLAVADAALYQAKSAGRNRAAVL